MTDQSKTGALIERCPSISEALVVFLEGLVPPREPNLRESEREIFYYAGRRAVIQWLRTEYERQRSGD